MFYFRTTPFYPTELNDISQFRKVIQFQKKITILDFDNVPFIDSTGLKILNEFIKEKTKAFFI